MVPSSTACTGVFRGREDVDGFVLPRRRRASSLNCAGERVGLDAFDRHEKVPTVELELAGTSMGRCDPRPASSPESCVAGRRRRRWALRRDSRPLAAGRSPASRGSSRGGPCDHGGTIQSDTARAASPPGAIPAEEPAARPGRERPQVAPPVARSTGTQRFLHSVNTTRVPGLTSAASRIASQFVSRTQPCDSVRPICDGSGDPCRP